MPTVNIQQLKNQALYLETREGMSESEAIKKAIENAGISEEFATEINLEAEISRVMNLDSEQQRAEAEQQLKAQADASGSGSAITLDDGSVDPAPAEADSDMQGTAEAAPQDDATTF